MTISILLCDSLYLHNNIKPINYDLIIILGKYNIAKNTNSFICIESTINTVNCFKNQIQNEQISILHNLEFIYHKYLLPINKKYKLPIIYIKYNTYHIFVTSFVRMNILDNKLFKNQMNLLYNTIENHKIQFGENIFITGYFGCNFREHASELSTICQKLSCNIPNIKVTNSDIIDKFIIIKKSSSIANKQFIQYKNNACIYNK